MPGRIAAGLFVAALIATPLAHLAASRTAQPSAGELALLLANEMDATAIIAVRGAITADDPLVRKVAARMAAVTAHPPFSGSLHAAWERERDPVAAAEQMRALLLIRGDSVLPDVDARVARFAPIEASVYAEWLAVNRSDQLAPRLPAIAARATPSRTELIGSVSAALAKLGGRSDERRALLQAWRGVGGAEAWRYSI